MVVTQASFSDKFPEARLG